MSEYNIMQFEIKRKKSNSLDVIKEQIIKDLPEERKSEIGKIAQCIASLDSAEEVLHYMRKETSFVNAYLLMEKALKFEDEIYPSVMKMLKTTGNDHFIENATRFLSFCGRNPADELIYAFNEIRDMYMRSMIFVVLGFRAGEDAIPWIYLKYCDMMDEDTEDNLFSEGALVALYNMADRFKY